MVKLVNHKCKVYTKYPGHHTQYNTNHGLLKLLITNSKNVTDKQCIENNVFFQLTAQNHPLTISFMDSFVIVSVDLLSY